MSLVDPGLCIREKQLSGRSDQVYQRLISHMIEAILDTSQLPVWWCLDTASTSFQDVQYLKRDKMKELQVQILQLIPIRGYCYMYLGLGTDKDTAYGSFQVSTVPDTFYTKAYAYSS